jgi:WD40 repeat protein
MATHSQIIEHVHLPVNYTVYSTLWVPSSAKFAVFGAQARGTGALEVHELTRGKTARVTTVDHPHPLKCATFAASAPAERRPATGDFEGNLTVFDLETRAAVFSVAGHKGIVNAIDGVSGDAAVGAPEIVTGGRDGCVRVWDVRVREPVASLVPETAAAARDCWTVAFGDAHDADNRCVAAGYDNGDIKMFDLRTNSMLWETNVKNGVCGVEFDRRDIKRNKLVATALESSFAVYDLRTQHPTEGFAHLTEKAHSSTVWAARHLPQNRDIFMTCGGNGSLNLYKYKYPAERKLVDKETGEARGVPGTVELLASAPLSTQPIASFDWHKDKEGLCVMGSFDQAVRVAVVSRLNTA